MLILALLAMIIFTSSKYIEARLFWQAASLAEHKAHHHAYFYFEVLLIFDAKRLNIIGMIFTVSASIFRLPVMWPEPGRQPEETCDVRFSAISQRFI